MKNFMFMVICIFLTGCEVDLDFKRPEVVSVSPSHNSTLVPADSKIVIDFNKSMDTVLCNNEFSLNSDSGTVEGIFAWENGDKRLVFTPRENLSVSDKYTIRVSDGAEDASGNDLKDAFVSVFYIKGENGSPYVTSYNPLSDTIGNPRNTQVVITFSEPVDLSAIYNGISISPLTEGSFSWNAGVTDSTVITFTPLYGFNYGVTYSVNISDSIMDISGNTLREPVTFNFTVGDDFAKPEIAVYQDLNPPLGFTETMIAHNAEKESRIVIRFTEIINTENLRSAISISPSAGFYVSSEVVAGLTTAYINFTDKLVSEETYTLRVNSSITDLQGNPLAKDYRYVFVTDGNNSIAPIVSEIGDLVPPALPALQHWVKDDIQPLALQASPLNPLMYPDIIVDFNHEIDPLTLSMYAETAAGTGGSPSVININWPDIAPVTKFTRLKFGLYNIGTGNIYKIVIKGGKNGLKDMNGNYMKEDFVQMVSF